MLPGNHACGWITQRRSRPLALVRFVSWLTGVDLGVSSVLIKLHVPGAGRHRTAVLPLKPRGAREEGRTGRALQSRAWMGSPEPTLLCGLEQPQRSCQRSWSLLTSGLPVSFFPESRRAPERCLGQSRGVSGPHQLPARRGAAERGPVSCRAGLEGSGHHRWRAQGITEIFQLCLVGEQQEV